MPQLEAWISFQCFLLVVGVVFLLEDDQNEWRGGRLIFLTDSSTKSWPSSCSGAAALASAVGTVGCADTSVSTSGCEMTAST